MEPLRDSTWIKYLFSGPPVERIRRTGYSAALVSVPRTEERHYERYRYRAFFFEPAGKIPVLAVNLESDILGAFLLTREDAHERRVLDRYDQEPPFEVFRARAFEEARRGMRTRSPSAEEKRRSGVRGRSAR